MKPIYTKEEFDKAKSSTKLPCKCYVCSKIFYTQKKFIILTLNKHKSKYNDYTNSCKYCSKECQTIGLTKKENVVCLNCDKLFEKTLSQIKKSPNHFCSQSCAASYNNKHKTHGNIRSKLEKYLEEQLTLLYHDLDIHFNRKDAIGSELDIYIPSLNLAFELNGIFHYEPIYGINKLEQVKNNDISKAKACYDAKIDLCIIDTSSQKYVKPSTSQKYLDIITNIIKERLLTS